MTAAAGANATAATASAKSRPKRGTKSSPTNGSKKSSRPTPVKQSNTLDMWFKQAAPMTKPAEKAIAGQKTDAATSSKDGNTNAVDNGEHSTSASSELLEVLNVDPPLKKKKVNPESASAKKLVQRRIHINDLCRVCGNARIEASSRCELRCMGCDMTVHTKCYDIQLDEPVDDWHCRRCQYILDKKEELKIGGIESVIEDDNGDKDTALLPAHEHLEATHKYHELHSSSDFATIFQFLKRFRRMGLKVSSDVTLHNLADALMSPQQNLPFVKELHVRLLTNVEATMSKNHGWTVSLARFLKETEHHPSSTRVDAFLAASAEPSSKKGNSETSIESVLSTRTKELYVDLSVSERVAILKFLCEAQFDENEALVERIGDQEGNSLRDEPVGTDASGRTYWVLEDAPFVLDGTVWVCRCAKQDGCDWETVADDLETLESLITWLSLSFEMLELQLWTTLSSGILKSLTRRHKKKLQSEQRMARMPRLLGTAGLDLASLASADGDDGFGVRRSTRARRAVSYRIEESDEEEEEEEAEEEDVENASDDDGEEEDAATASGKKEDDDTRPRKRLRRSRPSLDASKPAIAPSRQSARLRRSTRGADSNDDDDDDDAVC
uniref:PHD-type domain-containing protein n=1 Tax=Globisporangium ultimum (strain ATCC 200006 / CBS 805.95 / DAOM BR144) TaxID=431595 RepID=K3WZ96_GLOUD